MTLKEKLILCRQILVNGDRYVDKLPECALIGNEIKKLSDEKEALIRENQNLIIEIEKNKSAEENLKIISSKGACKTKLIKPSKIVIVKYSLPINRERTHISAFIKKDLFYLIHDYSYNRREYGVGYVLEGLFDKTLRGLLNEYGEKFDHFVDDKNTEYTSNILIYDYLTLPQVLDLMDLPVDVNIDGVTLDVINAAVKYAKLGKEVLFNEKISKRRLVLKSKK